MPLSKAEKAITQNAGKPPVKPRKAASKAIPLPASESPAQATAAAKNPASPARRPYQRKAVQLIPAGHVKLPNGQVVPIPARMRFFNEKKQNNNAKKGARSYL